MNGTLFFIANDGVDGMELMESNGSGRGFGTILVKDIYPGPAGSYPAQLTNVNGTLFFSANDGRHGREPWVLTPPASMGESRGFKQAGEARVSVRSPVVSSPAISALKLSSPLETGTESQKLGSAPVSRASVDSYFSSIAAGPQHLDQAGIKPRGVPQSDDWLSGIFDGPWQSRG